MNLTTRKVEHHHVYDLKPFLLDPKSTTENDLRTLAQADGEEWKVEKVLQDVGNSKKRLDLEFVVKCTSRVPTIDAGVKTLGATKRKV
mmetsp:Transcript_13782/g.14974  ORF Transcript_13782/g.14974 Transcript_13782/m.14974 type:complete len:88 (-) Transcript_13782:371-634(-)